MIVSKSFFSRCLCFTWLLFGSFSTLLAGNAKNIFLFIGDGMGSNQVLLADAWLRAKSGSGLAMLGLKQRTETKTDDVRGKTTDSAAAATAIASGVKTINGRLLLDGEDKPLTPISFHLRDRGYQVGLLTSCSPDHATPAGFYARQGKRSDYYEVAAQLATSGFWMVIGGGFLKPQPEGKTSLRDLLTGKGWQFVDSYAQFMNLVAGQCAFPLLALQPGRSSFYDQLGHPEGEYTLASALEKALALVPRDKPFFFMIEGSAIDWKCHENDLAGAVHETLDFDRAVGVALRFQAASPHDTLILITADHETGGLKLAPGYQAQAAALSTHRQTGSAFHSQIKEMRKEGGLAEPKVAAAFTAVYGIDWGKGLGEEERNTLRASFTSTASAAELKSMYGSYDPVYIVANRIVSQRAGAHWTSFGHTSTPVWTWVSGPGEASLGRLADNTGFNAFILENALAEKSR
jgi:alkaline phosphatase